MSSEHYIIETLEIELFRLKQEDRTEIHYTKRNENNQVSKDRWEIINGLEKAINYLTKLTATDKGKKWKDGNQFNDAENFWK